MAKKTNRKIPKRIAGVKVPKELRKAGDTAMKLAEHPMLADVIAAGLLAAAAALTQSETARDAAESVGEDAEEGARQAARKAGRVKTAVKAAAGAMGKSLLDEIKGGKGRGKRG